MAASVENLGWNTRMFLESETTEDLELVLVLNQIEKTGKWYPRGTQLVDKLEAGKAGREEARALLATLKEEITAEKAQKKADKKAAQQGTLELDGQAREPEPPKWNAWDAESTLASALGDKNHAPIAELIQELTKAQQGEIAGHYKEAYDAGKAVCKANQLAIATGTSRQVVSNWRHGHKEPGSDKQAQMAEMAGLDVGYHVTASAVEKTGNATALAWLAERARDWRKL